MNCKNCQHGEGSHETVEYRGDKFRACLEIGCKCKRFQEPATINDIENAEFALEMARKEYLQRFGWKYTSNTPGSYWLWERTMEDGRVFVADTSMAMSITTRGLDRSHE